MAEQHNRFIGEADDVIIEQPDGAMYASQRSPREWNVIDERIAAIREYGKTGDRSVLVRAGLAPAQPDPDARV